MLNELARAKVLTQGHWTHFWVETHWLGSEGEKRAWTNKGKEAAFWKLGDAVNLQQVKAEWPHVQWEALIQQLWSIEYSGRVLTHLLDNWARPQFGRTTGNAPNRLTWLEGQSFSYLLEQHIHFLTLRYNNDTTLGTGGISRPLNQDWVYVGCETGTILHKSELTIAIEVREALWCEDSNRANKDRVKSSLTLKKAHLCI